LLYNGPLLCGFNVPIKGLKSISRTQAATDNGTFTAAFAYRKENKHVVLICKIDLNS